MLAFAARDRPVVLILDDLHWADTSTSLLLGHLLQDAAPMRLLVLGTTRPGESALGELVSRLRRQPMFERIDVSGLTAEEARAMISEDVTSQFVRRLTEETEGNPFFIAETLRTLPELEERALSRIAVPEGVKEMISRRLGQLSETTNHVLSVASVVGRQFDLQLLEELARRIPSTRSRRPPTPAWCARPTSSIASSSPTRSCARRSTTARAPRRRVRLHRRIGEALESAGDANPAELAYHFFEGRSPQAADYALDAAEQAAAAFAYEEAAEHYRRAGDDVPTLLALGAMELRAGDPAFRETFATAFDRAEDRETQAEAALGFSGRHAEAGVIDRQGIDAARAGAGARSPTTTSSPSQLRARLIDRLQFTEQRGRALELSAEALAIAHRLDDPKALLVALESRHAALMHVDHLDERLRLSEELLALAARIGERELEALGHHWRIFDLLEAARIDDARDAHRRLATIAAELRQPLYHHFSAGWEVVWAQMAGRVADAERLAREAYELGRRAHARDADVIYAAQTLILRRREDALQDFTGHDRRPHRAQSRAGRLARDPADGAPAGREHAGRRGRVPRARAGRLRRDPARHVLADRDRPARRDLRADRRPRAGARPLPPARTALATSSSRSRRPRTSARPTASSRC